jgi:hypothetical protein
MTEGKISSRTFQQSKQTATKWPVLAVRAHNDHSGNLKEVKLFNKGYFAGPAMALFLGSQASGDRTGALSALSVLDCEPR